LYTEPKELDRSELKTLLAHHWSLHGVDLEYLPLGFGSHHWLAVDSRGTRRFVTADDLFAGFQRGPDADSAFVSLDRAFRTATVLRHEAELEFVVAPLPDEQDVVMRRLDDRYAVTVFPFIAGESRADGSYESSADRRHMSRILGRLHAATERLPEDLPDKEDFALPSRGALLEALRDLDRPWTSGPFGEPARQLLRRSARDLERRLREYDELAAEVAQTSESWVVTHGEPHRANVIRDARGRLLLVDWDTTLVAPRERDLRMVLDRDMTGWDDYRGISSSISLDHRAMRLYHLWWDLAEIGIYTERFRRPHGRTEDIVVSWEALTGYLPVRDR
jgi:spectinomycin phosphotransferase